MTPFMMTIIKPKNLNHKLKVTQIKVNKNFFWGDNLRVIVLIKKRIYFYKNLEIYMLIKN